MSSLLSDGGEPSSPIDISDHLLEVTRKAYLERDFDSFAKCFALPQVLGTFDQEGHLETLEDLRHLFETVVNNLTLRGVIDMRRKTIAAEYHGKDEIRATFTSQYLLPGLVLSEEVVGHSILRRTDSIWRVAGSHYVAEKDDFIGALRTALQKKTPPAQS